MHVAVLGAGVIGVTTAYALAKRGCKVTIFDQAGSIAAGASFANGAQISYSFVDPMASPAMLKKIPAILLGKDPNIKQKPSLEPAHLRWGAYFLGNCTEPKATSNLENAISLALESRAAFQDLLTQHSISFRYRQSGKLVVTRNKATLARMQHAARIKTNSGIEAQSLTAEECWQVEPKTEPHYRDIVGGIYAPGDYVGDARRFTKALSQICIDDYGVDIRLKQKVFGLATDGDNVIGVRTGEGVFSADKVVVCMGAASAKFLSPYNIPLLIEPVKGYSFTIPANDEAPSCSLTDADHKIVFARLHSEMRIAGLADFDGDDMSLKEDRLATLKGFAERLLPNIGDYGHSGTGWVGARPMTPDGLPITRATKVSNLYLNTGHGMLGWTLACGSAERIVEIMMQQRAGSSQQKRAAQ